MKIAIIAPIEEPIPPTKYGGIEWIVYEVAHGMARRGHSVDLYATGDSKQNEESYRLIPTIGRSIRTDPMIVSDESLRRYIKFVTYSEIAKKVSQENYDIIHNHCDWRFLLFSHFLKPPIVTTHHGPLNPSHIHMAFSHFKNQPYISISNNQRKDLPELNYIATIYNGVDTNLYPYSDVPTLDSEMLFMARFSSEKGPREAAQVAHIVKKKLTIAAKLDTVDKEYYEACKPLIDTNFVSEKGEMDFAEKIRLYQGARLLLLPIQWEEPFGLMFIESMSCGTPVVTFARGSAPEIIKDGKTGFLVNQSEELKRGDWIIKKTGVEGLCEAVERIYSMSNDIYQEMRKACREHIEKNFTVEKMIDQYEEVYRKILSH